MLANHDDSAGSFSRFHISASLSLMCRSNFISRSRAMGGA